MSLTNGPDVNTDTTRFLALLEQRIGLLGSLAEALVAARTDITSFDIDGLEARIAGQQRLCADINSLDAQIDAMQQKCATHLSASSGAAISVAVGPNGSPLGETLARLRAVQASVKQLNDAHQVLLLRSRRTVGALLNSYHSFAMTYSDPASARTSIGERA